METRRVNFVQYAPHLAQHAREQQQPVSPVRLITSFTEPIHVEHAPVVNSMPVPINVNYAIVIAPLVRL